MNIFDGIFHRENNVTEVLNNLMYYKPFRKAFFDFLDLDIKDTKSVTIETQVELQHDEKNFGIIDMMIRDGDTEYLIEIKTNRWTPLSKHQIKDHYQEYIDQNKNIGGRLIYLIPNNYRHKKDIMGEKKYWGDFSKAIKAKELDKLNPFIEHFVKAISQESVYKFSACELDLILQKGEVSVENKTIPGIIKKLQGIIDEVSSESIKGLKANKKLGRIDSSFYGYSFDKFKDIELWFGVDYNVWEAKGYPIILWLFSDKNETMEKLKNNQSLTEICFERYDDKLQGEEVLILPFREENELNENVIIEKITKTIEALSKKNN